MPAVTAGIGAGGQLVIQGGNTAENVQVFRRPTISGDQIVVNVSDGVFRQFAFRAAGITRIVYNGNGGNDVCVNNTGIVSIQRGGAGNDTLVGGAALDLLDGGAGDDALNGRGGNDQLFGVLGRDKLYGLEGNDYLDGGAEDDYIDGGAGNDVCVGQAGADDLHGGLNDDLLNGGVGDDHLNGESGNDLLFGASNRDSLRGGSGHDYLDGGADDDFVDGEDGDDRLFGRDGNDDIRGSNGNDSCDGGVGDDHVSGGRGSDTESNGEFGGPETAFVARLANAAGVRAEVEFEREVEGTITKTKFKVELEHAPANAAFSVLVGGVQVGTLQTNSFGRGELFLLNPTTLPPIMAGTTVAIGNLLQGAFSQNLAVVDEFEGPEIAFDATLVGAAAAHGKAEFERELEGSVATVKFKAEIEDAAANTTYAVLVGGVQVGNIVTDALGNGRLELVNPADFPAVDAGATVSIGGVVNGSFVLRIV